MQIIRFTHKKSDPQYGWINENLVGHAEQPSLWRLQAA